MKETQGFFQRVAQRYVGGFSLINFSIYPLGKLRVYCLKTLNKLSIYPLGKTPSAPSVFTHVVTDNTVTKGGTLIGVELVMS